MKAIFLYKNGKTFTVKNVTEETFRVLSNPSFEGNATTVSYEIYRDFDKFPSVSRLVKALSEERSKEGIRLVSDTQGLEGAYVTTQHTIDIKASGLAGVILFTSLESISNELHSFDEVDTYANASSGVFISFDNITPYVVADALKQLY